MEGLLHICSEVEDAVGDILYVCVYAKVHVLITDCFTLLALLAKRNPLIPVCKSLTIGMLISSLE